MRLIMTLTLAAAMTTASAQTDNHPNGINLSNLDKTVSPGADFYTYAVGGWQKSHPLGAEYATFGAFNMLDELNNQRIREIIEELAKEKHPAGSNEDKIATIYNMSMDMEARNKAGMQPIVAYTDKIKECQSKEALLDICAQMMLRDINTFFAVGVDADAKDSKMNLVQIWQGGPTLGEREYYIDQDEHTQSIRKAYIEFGGKAFKMLYPDFTDAQAEAAMNTVLRIETRLAKAFKSNAELRIAEENYDKVPFSKLGEEYPHINWNDLFFKSGGFPQFYELSLGQPEALKAADLLIAEENLEDLKTYVTFRELVSDLSLCGEEQINLSFDFFGRTLQGRQSLQPLWKRSVSMANGLLGEAVGLIYVQKYFPESSKRQMKKLVDNLGIALGNRIMEQEWMSDETKKKALEKLGTFYVKIGYPDTWKDYSNIDFSNTASFCDAINSARIAKNRQEIQETVSKPVDRNKWYMTPQTVNAYYNPATNEICFPAGILQYPFFDPKADDAFNYGAIGVVIGHEMTHGFDDQGRKFDKEGNMTDWWSKEDQERFNKRAQVIVDFYDNINVLPDLKANGSLTQGENLADHGGLQVAYEALRLANKGKSGKKKDGFTDDQRFFLAYAGVWANNIRTEEIRRRTKSDPHSLAKWRVNGALPHIDAWYKAFDIKESDPLFVPKTERVTIW
ncbi:MAG: M13 family metallopeptidase [Prevotellaceae bacterium]|nr:M13 family metallopeptidase [Prevotellaceae bacterium]